MIGLSGRLPSAGDLERGGEHPSGRFGRDGGPDLLGGSWDDHLAADFEFLGHCYFSVSGASMAWVVMVWGVVRLGCKATTRRCLRPPSELPL